jgi:hypothetical protein
MADDHDRAEFVRRLVLARCPELSLADLEAAFGDGAGDQTAAAFADDASDHNASVLAEIANAVADAIEALEERLTELEKGLPWRVH